MTIIQAAKYLEQIALSSPYIRTTKEGSVYDIMNTNGKIKYGVFVLSQTQHRQDDLFDYIGFNAFVIDRLDDDLESNRLQIQSTAKEVLANIVLTFKNRFYGSTFEQLVFHPFTEKFVDLCAGVYVQLNIKVPRTLICPDEYGELVHSDNLIPLTITITENGVKEYKPETFDADGFDDVKITVNVPQTGETINNQTKSISITENGTSAITYDNGFTGLETVNIEVNVAQTGYTQEDLDRAYQSGYTKGWNDAKEGSGSTSGYSNQYLTFEIISGGSFYFKASNSATTLRTIYYKINNEDNWNELEAQIGYKHREISIHSGDIIILKGENSGYWDNVTMGNNFYFSSSVKLNIYGNIMSLIYGDNFIGQTILPSNRTFEHLFSYGINDRTHNIISAENLILPATTLTEYCYAYMFYGCASLTTAPTIPDTSLGLRSMQDIFYFCESLNKIKCLATAPDNSNYTYFQWLGNVSSTGVFIKKAGVTWSRSDSGIPSGWTILEE